VPKKRIPRLSGAPSDPHRLRGKSKESALDDQSPRELRRVPFGNRLLSLIAALGIMGAIGSYYVPRILSSLEDKLDTRSPVIVDEPSYGTETPNFIFPRSTSPRSVPGDLFLRAASNNQELQLWAQDHGGVALGEQSVQLVVRARGGDSIVISDVQAVVQRRETPSADWFNSWSGCGGLAEVRVMTADLSDDVVEHQWKSSGKDLPSPPVLRVTNQDIEVIKVEVSAPRAPPQLILWTIELRYSSRQESGSLEIDAGGAPFQLASGSTARDAVEYEYGDAASGLVRVPARQRNGVIC
jgi:hypothetical protein